MEAKIESPQNMTTHDRNYRMYEKLLAGGYSVYPIFSEGSNYEVKFIDALIISASDEKAKKIANDLNEKIFPKI
ncbi:MAG: hypothetical protein L0Y77_01745 [Chlorobi bacterium]|nr:hypothetical protein [Chlorobiota bacterium]